MRKKKDLPLVILQALEPFVKLKGDKFEVMDPKGYLLKVIDKDPESEFEFILEQYKRENNAKFQFLMTRSPKSVYDNGKYQMWVEISGLNAQFETWVKLLNQYETVSSFFDDPITQTFKDEFYAEFEIIDDDAEYNPLKTKQILLLDNYLHDIESRLTNYVTDSNGNDIQEIQADIASLRNHLTLRSKKWIINKLTTIWAKIAKQGTNFVREFLTESKKELIKQGIKGIIDYAKENGHDLIN